MIRIDYASLSLSAATSAFSLFFLSRSFSKEESVCVMCY